MRSRVDVLGILIDKVNKREALEKIENFISSEGSKIVVTPNAEMIVRSQKDSRLKEIINSAQLVLPDGAGVVIASRLLNKSLEERVSGIDIVQELLNRGSKKGYSFYFLGGKPGVAQKAKEEALNRYPNLDINFHHGYLDRQLEKKVVEEIKVSKVDILLVGMGVPLQEKWLDKHLSFLGVPVGIGVGGSFDILSGEKRRAPQMVQKLNLEWLYRLAQEPSRAGRMVSLPKFIHQVLKQKINRIK
ncbi:WecB/TagA/CpsF family glycosyltransferase [Halonatronum saccharophilum]|uniref:WecB/TagA/CpsF family glycosyltransferase n=1 Tax=Halonatronum saccharophilum TaxID=150060 RepID=UPI0004803354|nr:WecB/TagA/CpsF family glycosyltransferase [Halonatronum saccharophilum]